MKAQFIDPRQFRSTDEDVEVQAENSHSDSSDYTHIDIATANTVEAVHADTSCLTTEPTCEQERVLIYEPDYSPFKRSLPSLSKISKSFSSNDRKQVLSTIRQIQRLQNDEQLFVTRNSEKSSVTFGASSVQDEINDKPSEQHSFMEDEVNPAFMEQIQVEGTPLAKSLQKKSKSARNLHRVKTGKRIDSVEQLTKRLVGASDEKVLVRIDQIDYELSADVIYQLVASTSEQSNLVKNIYFSDQRDMEIQTESAPVFESQASTLVDKAIQTDTQQQFNQNMHLSNLSSPKESSIMEKKTSKREIHRFMSAQYTSEQVSIVFDKQPEATPKSGKSSVQTPEYRDNLTTISRVTDEAFFDEAQYMHMAPFLSNDSPKMDLLPSLTLQNPKKIETQLSSQLSGIEEKQSQNENDADIENAFWGESDSDDSQEEAHQAFLTSGIPSVPQKVQNPHKQLISEMPKRVAFAQQIESANKPDLQRISMGMTGQRRLSSALKKTKSVPKMIETIDSSLVNNNSINRTLTPKHSAQSAQRSQQSDDLFPPHPSAEQANLVLRSENREVQSQIDRVSHSSSQHSVDNCFRFHGGLLRQDSLNLQYVRPEVSEASPQIPYCSPPSTDIAGGIQQTQTWSELRLHSPVQNQWPTQEQNAPSGQLLQFLQEQSQQIQQLQATVIRMDRKYASVHNQAVRVIASHEENLVEMAQRTRTDEHNLHLAFLFASPLHIPILTKRQQDQSNGSEFVLMRPLNFQKEFLKIRDAVAQAQLRIRLTKRQCTLSSLNEILAKNPMAIHFSGHGFRNNMDELGRSLFLQHKDQGNLLLLETEHGEGKLVSTQTLKDMVHRNYQEKSKVLQLVVVASCHSEFVGEIFIEAGAQHVVCIQQQEEVDDDAVITFTESFYMLLFNRKTICDAFEQALRQVSLAHSDQQASIFKMLRQENVRCGNQNNRPASRSRSKCTQFGPFERGSVSLVDQTDVTFVNRAPLPVNLIGRQTDQFKLISVLLANKEARLVTLMGYEGVGKSSLILNSLEWIYERCLLRGGSIYLNARDIRCCTVLTRKLCKLIIDEAEILFASIAQLVNCDKQPYKALKLVLTKLAMVEGDLLLVIDNADELVHNDNSNFQKLLVHITSRTPALKVLISSCSLMHALLSKEQIVPLEGLPVTKSYDLFKQVAGPIQQCEQNRLLDIQPDYDQFEGERQHLRPSKIADHHFFRLLNGNPQSIILMASVRADPQREIDLPKLYKIMTSGQTKQLLKRARINDKKMRESLIRAAQVATQHMVDTDSESSDLFFILSMLPGGITDQELEQIWRQLNNFNSQTTCTTAALCVSLQRVKNKLLRANLVKREGNQTLRMPEYVRKFSEGRIDDEDDVRLHGVLAYWLEKKAFAQYISGSSDSDTKLGEADFERFEKNMDAFVERQILFEVRSEANDEEALDVVEPAQTLMSSYIQHSARAFDDYSDEMQSCLRMDQEQDQEEPASVEWDNDLSDNASEMLSQVRPSMINVASLSDIESPIAEEKKGAGMETEESADRSNLLLSILKNAMQSKYIGIFDQIKRDEGQSMTIHRSSISKRALRENSNDKGGPISQQRRQTFFSQRSHQILVTQTEEEGSSVAERAILFYLAIKMLHDNFSGVKKMIIHSSGPYSISGEHQSMSIEQMSISSFIFRGNIRRFLAFCLMSELQKDFRTSKFNRAANSLGRALLSFKKADSAWGLGLTHLQEALLLSYKLKNMKACETALASRDDLDDQLESKQELLTRFGISITAALSQLNKAKHSKGVQFATRLKAKMKQERSPGLHSSPFDSINDEDYEKPTNQWEGMEDRQQQETQIYFIEREQGEEFSLMTEIVLGTEAKSVFKRNVTVKEEESKDLTQSPWRGNEQHQRQSTFFAGGNEQCQRQSTFFAASRPLRQGTYVRIKVSPILEAHEQNDSNEMNRTQL